MAEKDRDYFEKLPVEEEQEAWENLKQDFQRLSARYEQEIREEEIKENQQYEKDESPRYDFRQPQGKFQNVKTTSPRHLLKEFAHHFVSPEHHEVNVQLTTEGRPETRKDCEEGGSNSERPCPYVGCRHHLYMCVDEYTGAIKWNFPGNEVWDLEETCALDVAGRYGQTLDETGRFLNLTRERIRQVEAICLEKFGIRWKQMFNKDDAPSVLEEKNNGNGELKGDGEEVEEEDEEEFTDDLSIDFSLD